MAIPVVFDKLHKNHPYHYQIYSLVDGQVAGYHPPCCIQVSYALNMSGAPIEDRDYFVPDQNRHLLTGGRRIIPDNSGRLYLIEVCDMGAYLKGKYGDPENYKGTIAQMKAGIAGRRGIIRFGRAHIDLWEGNRFHQENTKDMPDDWARGKDPVIVWERPSVKTDGIYFWECNGTEAPRVIDPRCGWPTPDWLLGWWEIRWRNTSYFYLFEPNGRVKWSENRPGSKASNMTTVNDNGSCFCLGRNVAIDWLSTGTKEEFDLTAAGAMKGTWNSSEPLTAKKLW